MKAVADYEDESNPNPASIFESNGLSLGDAIWYLNSRSNDSEKHSGPYGLGSTYLN